MKSLYFLLAICFFGIYSFANEEKKKVLPSYLQKAYVIQKNAIVYTRPDFDAVQINNIPAGALVTISKKIYRPKNRFGTFYRIYISKPKKLRAYISEIDVVPRYIKSGFQFKMNPEFNQVKKKLKYVKDFQFNSDDPETILDLSDQAISKMRLIGLLVSYSWMAYESKSHTFPSWFVGVKLSGPSLPIKRIATDMNLIFSLSPPVMDKRLLKKGYIIMGDFLFKLPLFEVPHFLLHVGGGFMVKLKGARAPEKPALFEVGGGMAGSGALTIRIQNRLALLVEGKFYYNLLENKFIPAISGGFLTRF
ncbi:MAG: hypothetical protein OXM55_03650 [Bdellovibrionales bacterium]|nr:hypothetical protein [Bdellovibrionales bacterium]